MSACQADPFSAIAEGGSVLRFLTLICAASLACLPAVALAQSSSFDEKELLASAEVARAEQLGELIYEYDQVGWYGTDQLVEDLDVEKEAGWLRGFLVEPDDRGRLWFVAYGEIDGVLVEAARYRVKGGKIRGGGVQPADARPVLSELSQKLARARGAAVQEAIDKEYGACSASSFNHVTLPPDENGVIAVYLLTPPVKQDSYPLGGHFRIDVGADGKVLSSRRFMNS